MSTQWCRVKSLFDSLAGLAASQRIERLRLLESGELVGELRDLLNHYDEAGSQFLASTVGLSVEKRESTRCYAFNPNDVVAGRFHIVRPVGRGGMGDVYEAMDTKSGNRVALKCIGNSSATDNSVRLFRREIEMTRQIADPNVCRVHEVFEHSSPSGEILLLSMEFVDGENLEQRLSRTGAIPLAEARPLVFQLLSGIAAAHREGVIHRDLKPSNIMIARSRSGEAERLVITDFGIARRQHTAGEEATVSGAVAGTFEYMAPEQLLGENSPASDIYTAGLIIFEMLAGRKPFDGDPLQQALRRLIEPLPRLKKISGKVPLLWDRVVNRCLQRHPIRRFQSAEQVERALQGDAWEGGMTGVLWWCSRRWKLLAMASALIAIAFGVGSRGVAVRDAGSLGAAPLSPETTGGGLTMHSAISPDGAWLAYVSDRDSESNLQLWVQKTGDESSRRRITTDGRDSSSPWFSSDGKRIIFRWERDGGGLYLVDLPGGQPRLLVSAGVEGRFSPDGKSVVYWTGEQAEHPTTEAAIYLISLAGGQPRRLVPEFATASNPVFLPNGHILFEGVRQRNLNYENSADWYVLDASSGIARATGALDGLRRRSLRRYNRLGNFLGDRLIFSARSLTAANIYQYRFDSVEYKALGDPEQITFTTALMESPAVAKNGLMAVTTSAGSLNVWQLPLRGNASDRRLTTSLHYDTHPTVSHDGLAVAFGRSLGRDREIWLKTPKGERALVTTKQEEKYWPVIRADGSEIAYSAIRGSLHSILVVRTKDGVIEKLCEECGDPLHFSRDGQSLLVFQGSPSRISLFDRKTRQMRTVVQSSFDLSEAQFSPDNRYVAFRESTGAERSRLWIAPVDSRGTVPASRWIPVTSDEAWNDKPHWPEDGRTLYFLSNRDGFACIWAQSVSLGRLRPTGDPRPVRHFHSHAFTPSEASRIAFNFVVSHDNLIANPAVQQGNIWTGRLSDTKMR